MRLYNYLCEKFAGATMYDGDLFEVFKNPDNKEFRELNDKSTFGLRFIIDVHTKTVYFSSSELLHEDFIKAIQPPISLDYDNYYKYGDDFDRYILGTMKGNYIESDVYNYVRKYNNDRLSNILEDLKELNTYPISWVSKWMSPFAVTKLIEDLIKYIEGRMK